MNVRRFTARAVRLWVPKMRRADDRTLAAYHRHAEDVFVLSEAIIIRRVCRSEMRRRSN